ncbi:hypothetical protein [Demequina salsinemoris]|uniref:hypothetical protein n=1 Tax=Demequina salsinemoris TaxID=577470 RepID=UPI000782A1AA|nr:hypothetical protein [Demequina salsinemoris]
MSKRNRFQAEFEAVDRTQPVKDLPEGVRGCARCGLAVRMETEPPTVTVTTMGTETTLSMGLTPQGGGQVVLPLCQACAARRDLAQRWAHDDALRRRYGSPDIVAARVWCALDGCELAGQAPPTTAPDMLRVVAAMMDAGAAAQFAARLSPVTVKGANAQQGTLTPWGHVSDDDRDDARAAYVDMLAAKVDRPTRQPCPSGGCLYCGVDAVTALTRSKPWTPHTFRVKSIGGRDNAARAGFLCPTCERAYVTEGANGPSALDVLPREVVNAVGWC